MSDNAATQQPDADAKVEHVAFPIGLGFVAGFVDVFGFMSWFGLLTAHVTGNLIFMAYDIVRGHYEFIIKLAALPVFAGAAAASAWFIFALTARGRHPFQAAIMLEATVLGICMVACLMLPAPRGPDDSTIMIVGPLAICAMALQSTIMRVILNDLPPTTVITSNITQMLSEAVEIAGRFGVAQTPAGKAKLARRAKDIAVTITAFTAGAIAGGLAQLHFGPLGLLVPIAVLLGLLPFGQIALHAARQV
jgi:uncharacterized membrane protein YoaK (UPF0700 family)